MSEFYKILLHRARHYSLLIFLSIIPLVQIPNESARQTQEHFYQYFAICLMAMFIGNFWIGAFIVWNVILYNLAGASVGSMQVLNIFFGSMIFLISRNYFKTNKLQDYYKPIIWIGLASMLFMLLQLLRIDPIFKGAGPGNELLTTGFGDPVGLFGIKMANGVFLTIMMPMIATLNPIISLFALIPIALSSSSSVYMACAASMLLYTRYFYKKVFIALLVIIPILGSFGVYMDYKQDPLTFNSRFSMWHAVVFKSLIHPLGYGPDSFRKTNKLKDYTFHSDGKYRIGFGRPIGNGETVFNYYRPDNDQEKIDAMMKDAYINGLPRNNQGKTEFNFWDNPHNLYLNILFQYGVIGFALLIGILRQMYFMFKETSKDKEYIVICCGILTFLIASMTNFPIELARLGYIFPILLGAFYAKHDISKELV